MSFPCKPEIIRTQTSSGVPTSVILKVLLLKVGFQLLLSLPLLFHLLLLQPASDGLQSTGAAVDFRQFKHIHLDRGNPLYSVKWLLKMSFITYKCYNGRRKGDNYPREMDPTTSNVIIDECIH